ncbi:MAG: hypothetical protein HY841_04325 [Bacteroidetes bacterium]|nr:hypothetical protein [Bacteroidota bacterium]
MNTNIPVRNIVFFLLFTVIGFLAYKDCFGILMPCDTYGQFYLFEKGFITGFNEYSQTAAPYFSGYSIVYFLYHFFGLVPSYWISAGILLHALNTFLVFLIVKLFFKICLNRTTETVAFFSALIFLVSPYQTEDILWLNIRWLFHASVALAGLYFFILYLTDPSVKKVSVIHFLFLLGIFSNEITAIVPVICLVIYFLFQKLHKTNMSLKKVIIQIIFIQVLFIALYFLFCKIRYGHWIWHAGTSEHITQSGNYVKTLLKYFAKFFLFYRYIPVSEFDNLLRSFSSNYFLLSFLFLAVASFLAFFFMRIVKNKKEEGYFLISIFICFILFLLPMLPLDSSFLKYIYPDRYGYLASVFFYIFVSASFFFVLRKFAFAAMTGYAVLCWVLLMQTIPVWNKANNYCNRLVEQYKPFIKYDHVYVLNIPAYYKGIAAFRSSFDASIFFTYDKSPIKKIQVIAGCYQDFDSDSIASVKTIGNEIQVIGPKKKTPYFSTGGGWAKSYETDQYKVTFDSAKCSYLLRFKNEIPLNSAFIYAGSDSWKKAE